MRPTGRTLFLFFSYALVTSCGGSSSSNPSLSFDSTLPITVYQSTECLEPSEYKATIGLTPEDIQVLSACIHKDSSKSKLIIETKPNVWAQVLYSDSIALTTARKFFSGHEELGYEKFGMVPFDENKLFQAYKDKWKSYLDILNRLPKEKNGHFECFKPPKHEHQNILNAILEDKMLEDFNLSLRKKSNKFEMINNLNTFNPSFKIKLNSNTRDVEIYHHYQIDFHKPEVKDWAQYFDDFHFFSSYFPFKEVIVSTKQIVE